MTEQPTPEPDVAPAFDAVINPSWQVGMLNIDNQHVLMLRVQVSPDRPVLSLVLGLNQAAQLAGALLSTSELVDQARKAAVAEPAGPGLAGAETRGSA